jgi:peptidyl-tRNA hydrolase
MSERYLKQAIIVRKDLSMPTGKAMAMVSHASMTFFVKRLLHMGDDPNIKPLVRFSVHVNPEQANWLTELEPGLEEIDQKSFAKIVLQVYSESELLAKEKAAKELGLECHRVVDGGHSHNKPNTLVCIAIGPDWPEKLDPVTRDLKVYR